MPRASNKVAISGTGGKKNMDGLGKLPTMTLLVHNTFFFIFPMSSETAFRFLKSKGGPFEVKK